jgi:hypothetical protein
LKWYKLDNDTDILCCYHQVNMLYHVAMTMRTLLCYYYTVIWVSSVMWSRSRKG